MTFSEAVRNWVLEPVLEKLKEQEIKMAKTQAEFRELMASHKEHHDAQIAQTATLIGLIRELLAKVPPSPDYQEEFDALKAMTDELVADDAEVQSAVDAANAGTTPPAA